MLRRFLFSRSDESSDERERERESERWMDGHRPKESPCVFIPTQYDKTVSPLF